MKENLTTIPTEELAKIMAKAELFENLLYGRITRLEFDEALKVLNFDPLVDPNMEETEKWFGLEGKTDTLNLGS